MIMINVLMLKKLQHAWNMKQLNNSKIICMIMIKIVNYNVIKNIILKQKILKNVLHNVMTNINIFIN